MSVVSLLKGTTFLFVLVTCCFFGFPTLLFPSMVLSCFSRKWFHTVCHAVASSWLRLVSVSLSIIYMPLLNDKDVNECFDRFSYCRRWWVSGDTY